MTTAPVHQVWVGNIPYETTEEALRDVMASAGTVVSVRIRYDKESGQSKGFAFCEYEAAESCALAVKHLNGTLFGGRTLRVDFCSSEQARPMFSETVDWVSGRRTTPLAALLKDDTGHYSTTDNQDTGGGGRVPLQQTNTQDTNLRVEVCCLVESLTVSQLFYILGHIQHLVVQSPEYARRLLRENPPLCYALVHALFICDMIQERPEGGMADDDVLLQNIYDDHRRRQQQLLDARRFHERTTQDLQQQLAAENARINGLSTPAGATAPPPPPLPVPGRLSPIEGPALPPVVQPPHLDPVLPTKQRATHLRSEVIGQSDDSSIGASYHVLSQPEILQQISRVTPEQEALLSESERLEIMAIRQALQERGVVT